MQTPIALLEQFDVTFADVRLFVARPEVTQNFWTFRRFRGACGEPPEDVESTILVQLQCAQDVPELIPLSHQVTLRRR